MNIIITIIIITITIVTTIHKGRQSKHINRDSIGRFKTTKLEKSTISILKKNSWVINNHIDDIV